MLAGPVQQTLCRQAVCKKSPVRALRRQAVCQKSPVQALGPVQTLGCMKCAERALCRRWGRYAVCTDHPVDHARRNRGWPLPTPLASQQLAVKGGFLRGREVQRQYCTSRTAQQELAATY